MRQPEALKEMTPLLWSPGTGTDVWEMFCACAEGDLATVTRLVDQNPALARCQYTYRTPLYFAVRENQAAVVVFLMEHGAGPAGPDLIEIARDRGYAEMEKLLDVKPREPVAEAIRARDLSRMGSLIDAAPELLRAGDKRGNQSIHWAAMTRQLDAIDDLLARGADIDAKRPDGARPIQLANGDYHFRGWRDVPGDWPTTPAHVIAHLRARGSEVDLSMACYLGELELVRALLDDEPALANKVTDYVSYYLSAGTPINNAAAKGHLEIVQLLLERGADPNLPEEGIAPHGHALYSAAANGHHEIARLLLEHGAYCNPEVESSADALSRAISNDDGKMIDLLCSYGASRGVHLLAYHGDVRTAAAVFAANPALADDPDALANAAGEGQEAFVRLMLRHQPDLPKRMSFPAWSVGAKTPELNALLFQHGMNPSRPDWLGATPLHHFARTGDVARAALFIEQGADLHARDEELCSTPLGWAAKFEKMEMVELLLKHGARANDAGPLWARPLAWAVRRGHGEIANLLKQHGAV